MLYFRKQSRRHYLSKPTPAFQKKLAAIIEQMQPPHRETTELKIQQLLDNDVTSFKALLDCVNDKSKPLETRITACWLLPRLKPTQHKKEQIADALLTAIDHEHGDLQFQAVIGLGDLYTVPSRVIETLATLMVSHLNSQIREAAAYAYRSVAQPGQSEVLISVSTDQDEGVSVRGMAIESLGKLGDASAIPVLIGLLSDRSAEVRFWSAFSLGSLGAVEALPELKRLIETDHEPVPGWHSVSQEAADAVANIERYQAANKKRGSS